MKSHPQPPSPKQDTRDIDSILLIGFGGPTPGCCQRFNPCLAEEQTAPEAYCFVSEILAQRMRERKPILDSDRGKETFLSAQVPIRPDQARINEVVAHYVELGGFSPFNDLTFEQASALEAEVGLPVYVGMRNWNPFLTQTLSQMIDNGHKRVLGIILSPFQTFASWEEYQQNVTDALDQLATGESSQHANSPRAESKANLRPTDVSARTTGSRFDRESTLDAMMEVAYLSPWWSEDGFAQAVVEEVRQSCLDWDRDRFQPAHLIFTAHGIPVSAASRSPYTRQFSQVATIIAEKLGKDFQIAYQSTPDNSLIPWTEPEITTVINFLNADVSSDVIVVPIGFICDHVEVLYDLDQEARTVAEAKGLQMVRVPTVGSSPTFIQMLSRRIRTFVSTL